MELLLLLLLGGGTAGYFLYEKGKSAGTTPGTGTGSGTGSGTVTVSPQALTIKIPQTPLNPYLGKIQSLPPAAGGSTPVLVNTATATTNPAASPVANPTGCYPYTSACTPTNLGEMVGDIRLKNYPIPPQNPGELIIFYTQRVNQIAADTLAKMMMAATGRFAAAPSSAPSFSMAPTYIAPVITMPSSGGSYPGWKAPQ